MRKFWMTAFTVALLLFARANLAHATGCPGEAVNTTPATDAFAKCICDIIGDGKAVPPRPDCLIYSPQRKAMEALKRAGCVSVATKAEIKTYCLDKGLSEAQAIYYSDKGFGLTFADCVVFNREADWQEGLVGDWRKKSVSQHEATHAAKHSSGGPYYAGNGASADEQGCAGWYREVMAQAAALDLLEFDLTTVSHTEADKAKIKEMIKLATSAMDTFLGGLCDKVDALPSTSTWKSTGQKCKDYATPLNERVKLLV